MTLADWLVIGFFAHSLLGVVFGALVAIGAIEQARNNPRAFATRRDRAVLCIQVFSVTALPLVMWGLSAWLEWRYARRRYGKGAQRAG